jgi:hypothetical protein
MNPVTLEERELRRLLAGYGDPRAPRAVLAGTSAMNCTRHWSWHSHCRTLTSGGLEVQTCSRRWPVVDGLVRRLPSFGRTPALERGGANINARLLKL